MIGGLCFIDEARRAAVNSHDRKVVEPDAEKKNHQARRADRVFQDLPVVAINGGPAGLTNFAPSRLRIADYILGELL